MKRISKSWMKALRFSLVLLVLCGILYPLALTGVSQLLFPKQANGSLIEVNGKVIGSTLIGQNFEDNRFLQGRPSAVNYNTYETQAEAESTAPASGSSNYAPSNDELLVRMEADLNQFLSENPGLTASDVPVDLLAASASGLDPDISVEAAMVQVERIAQASGLSNDEVKAIIESHIHEPVLGVIGNHAVNVLAVNLELAQKLGLLKD